MNLSIPPIAELGFVSKYQQWREHQIAALQRILATKKRFVIVEGPTGTGKSAIATGLQKIADAKMLYVVHTRQLQDQLETDFPYAKVLKGRRNYIPPYARLGQTCADCEKTKQHKQCSLCRDSLCPYEVAKKALLASSFGIINGALFLTEANYVGRLPEVGWDWTVFDEGEQLEDALMGFVEVRVSKKVVRDLRLLPPELKTKWQSWVPWAQETSKRIANYIQLQQLEPKEERRLERTADNLANFAASVDENRPWINCSPRDTWYEGPWIFKPVMVSEFADQFVWQHGKRFLIMSATILSVEQWCRDLGVARSEVEFISLPSTFPVENRRIIFRPAATMNHDKSQQNVGMMVRAIGDILAAHYSEQVLIHAHSYWLTRQIIERSHYAKRMISYTEADERDRALADFKAGKARILVAPSMERGIDLPGNLCRVIIFAKVPFPNLGDPQVKTRLYGSRKGQLWYAVQTARAVVQGTGRGMRAADDKCISYILDVSFERWYEQWRRLLPDWWREALIVEDV